jgi:zinc protease
LLQTILRTGLRALALAAAIVVQLSSAEAVEWPKSDIPPDPAVRFGVLPNGMRYAVMHNSTPENSVSVRFRIAAGAFQEADDQRGLAHFIEHMAFRGTTHFKDREIRETLARLGLQFGSDVNASTGTDQTIYRFDLPKPEGLDTAIAFMRDVASEVSFQKETIAPEAKVVLSELNLRNTPGLRAVREKLKFALRDPHASALPEGEPDIVANATVEDLRRFYLAFYRPERATLVIVGDVDVDAVETKIRQAFSNWSVPGPPGPDPKAEIRFLPPFEIKSFMEKNADSMLSLIWVRKPDPKPNDRARERRRLFEIVAQRVLSQRLQDEQRSQARPFLGAGVGVSQRTGIEKTTEFMIAYEPGSWRKALLSAERIRLSVMKNVTQSEIDRQVGELLAQFQTAVANSGTRPSASLANGIVSELAAGDIFTSPERDLEEFRKDVTHLTPSDIEQAFGEIFPAESPLIFVSSDEPIAGGEADIGKAFLEGPQAGSTAEAGQPVLTTWPYHGKNNPAAIIARKFVPEADATVVSFKNGVALTVKPTTFRSDEVSVAVKVGSGESGLPKDRIAPSWAIQAVIAGGLGSMPHQDVRRILSPARYQESAAILADGIYLSGDTTPADLGTQLEVLNAYISDPGFRPEGFSEVQADTLVALRRLPGNPQSLFRAKSRELMHGSDSRWALPSAEQVQGTSLKDFRDLLAPVLARAPVEVTIVGNVKVDDAIALTASTFGNLPDREPVLVQPASREAIEFKIHPMPLVIRHDGQSEQDVLGYFWKTHGRDPDVQDDADLAILSAIMRDRMFSQLRDQGLSYVPQSSSTQMRGFNFGYITATMQLPESQAGKFQAGVRAIVDDLKTAAIGQDELERARTPLVQGLLKQKQTNGYWTGLLSDAQEDAVAWTFPAEYEAALRRASAQDIQAAARKYLTDDRLLRINMVHMSADDPSSAQGH